MPDLTIVAGHRSLLGVARSAERRKAGGFGEHHFWVTRSGFWFGALYSCVNSLVRDAGRWLRRSARGRTPLLSETLFFGITGLTACGGLVSWMGCPGGRFVVDRRMVGVRFLRTQQRVKSQCLIGFR